MTITHKPTFSKQLKDIIEFIANDKPTASVRFKDELKHAINLLADNPYQYRKSFYFKSKNIRDMVFKGLL
jgi:plasmid stabilization system protein ParE